MTAKLPAFAMMILFGAVCLVGSVSRARAETEEDFAAVTLPTCSIDNFNRIIGYKALILKTIVFGKVWARPVNGPVFGVVTSSPTPKVSVTIVDPSAPGVFQCTGFGTIPNISGGTCKIGQQTLPWGSIQTTCPTNFP